MSISLVTWPSNLQQPDIPANANNQILQVLTQLAVEEVLNDAPTTTVDDIRKSWIVGTGTWPDSNIEPSVAQENDIAVCVGVDLWQYLRPNEGWEGRNLATAARIQFIADSGVGAWVDESTGTGVATIVPGTGITVDATDPANPIVATTVTSGSTQGKQAIYIAASAMRPSTAGGCAALAVIAGASNQPDKATLDFDATTQEYAQFAFAMPKKWNEGTITFVPHWSHAATATNFGVAWSLQAVAVSNDDTIAVNFGTAQTSVDTGGTTDDLYIGPESSAVTVAGTPAAEDLVFFRASRVTGDAGDTMAIDARLHGVTVYVTTNADTDA